MVRITQNSRSEVLLILGKNKNPVFCPCQQLYDVGRTLALQQVVDLFLVGGILGEMFFDVKSDEW